MVRLGAPPLIAVGAFDAGRLVLSRLPLPQADAWASAIFVDELDAADFKGTPNNVKRCATRLAHAGLELLNCDNTHTCIRARSSFQPSRPRAARTVPERTSGGLPKNVIPTIP